MEFASLPLANCVSGLGLHLNEPRPATHPEFLAPTLPVLMSSRNQSISLQSKVTGNQESCTPKSEEEGCPVLEALRCRLGPVCCLCPKHHRHRHLREAARCRAVSEKHPFSSCLCLSAGPKARTRVGWSEPLLKASGHHCSSLGQETEVRRAQGAQDSWLP